MSYRYFIHLAYDGHGYHGWQKQDNAITVQGEIEERLSTLLKQAVSIVGAGRTDAGVHASSFYAHFDFERIDYDRLQSIVYKLNSFLPKNISIFSIKEVSLDLHARFSAFERTYEYHIHTRKDPFINDYSCYLPQKVNVDVMNEACSILLGKQDFSSFSKSNTQVNSFICDISEAFWQQDGHRLVFRIRADRFLRNMVRAIVGTLLEIGYGKREPADLKTIIAAQSRSKAGFSVPAEGLFLVDVKYPTDLYLPEE